VASTRVDHHEVGPVRQGDVIDLALFGGIEQAAAHRVTAERLQHQRRHELDGCRRHDATHLMAVATQRPDQRGNLVGGDAAAHRDEDTTLLHRPKNRQQVEKTLLASEVNGSRRGVLAARPQGPAAGRAPSVPRGPPGPPPKRLKASQLANPTGSPVASAPFHGPAS
jgi:hypothetical protein